MTCRNSNAATFTCGINQCTYVGTFLTNASAGQIDLKFGTAATNCGAAVLSVFNAYNRRNARATISDTSVILELTPGRAGGPRMGHRRARLRLSLDLTKISFHGEYLDQIGDRCIGHAFVFGDRAEL